MVNTSDAWEEQGKQGYQRYVNSLPGRLQIAIERAKTNSPFELRAHLESILTLLERARPYDELYSQIIELVGLLHPLPFRFGYWQQWEAELRFIITICTPEQRAKFLTDLADIVLMMGRQSEALEMVEAALTLCRQYHLVRTVPEVLSGIVGIMLQQGRVDEAEALFEQILDEFFASDTRDSLSYARVLQLHGVMLRRRGRFPAAVAELTEAINYLQRESHEVIHGYGHAYRLRGLMFWDLYEYAQAIRDLREARDLFREEGDTFSASWALGNLGLVYWSMGDLMRAEMATDYSVKIARRWQAGLQMTSQVGNQGLIALSQGRLKQAKRLIEEQATLAAKHNFTFEIARSRGNLGIVKMHMGDYEAALDDLQTALEMQKGYQAKPNAIANTQVNIGRCLAYLGQRDAGEKEIKGALKVSRELGDIPLELIALRCLAQISPPDEARQLLKDALRLSKNRRLDRAACLLSLAGVTAHPERRERLWNKGKRLLDWAGATAWLHKHERSDNPPHIPALT